MLVLMRISRAWQHAGREEVLQIGQAYDLPDVVARDLLASGAASQPADLREVKPAAAHETKGRRR